MINKLTYCLIVAPTLLLFQGYAIGQEQDKQSENTGPIEKIEGNLNTINKYYSQISDKLKLRSQRDPFTYTEEMLRKQQNTSARNKNTQFNGKKLPNELSATPHMFTDSGLPAMKYRGFSESASGEEIGLLEIVGMGVYTVRVGDKIGLHEIVNELVLTVEGLSRNNIIIETGKLGKKMVIQ